MFLRKSRIEPLPVTMSAVRMGERVLQIGIDDPAVASALAAKVGLSGNAAIAVTDDEGAARARSAAASAGVLVDVQVTPLSPLPFESGAFDLVIAHSMRGLVSSLDANARTAALREWHRVLRARGRVMTIEAGPASGFKRLLRYSQLDDAYDASGGVVSALEAAGFRAVRVLAEREGYKFTEGIKTEPGPKGPGLQPGRAGLQPGRAGPFGPAIMRGQPDRPAKATSIEFAVISGLNRPAH